MHAESGAAVSAAEMKTESHSLDRYRVRLLAILALINFVNFADRLVVRALVGVGEAAYAPAAQSLISGACSAAARARAQAVFAAGMLAGATAGMVLGSVIGEKLGWRPAFFIIATPGLIFALLVLRLEELPGGPRSELVPIGHLLAVPAYLALVASGVLITFTSVAFLFG